MTYRNPDDPYAKTPRGRIVTALGVAAVIGGTWAITSSLPVAVVAFIVFACVPLALLGAMSVIDLIADRSGR